MNAPSYVDGPCGRAGGGEAQIARPSRPRGPPRLRPWQGAVRTVRYTHSTTGIASPCALARPSNPPPRPHEPFAAASCGRVGVRERRKSLAPAAHAARRGCCFGRGRLGWCPTRVPPRASRVPARSPARAILRHALTTSPSVGAPRKASAACDSDCTRVITVYIFNRRSPCTRTRGAPPNKSST